MQYPSKFRFCREALLHVLTRLEGGTGRIVAGGRVGGAYGDLSGGTTGLAVVIGAILHVTGNTLDVITALLVVHKSVPSFSF